MGDALWGPPNLMIQSDCIVFISVLIWEQEAIASKYFEPQVNKLTFYGLKGIYTWARKNAVSHAISQPLPKSLCVLTITYILANTGFLEFSVVWVWFFSVFLY